MGNGNSHFKLEIEDLNVFDSSADPVYGHIDIEDKTGTHGIVENQYGGTPLMWHSSLNYYNYYEQNR